jgi:hypothetical protein
MYQPIETRPSLFSSRTAKYVEALNREGDDFNYRRWLRRVREEEAEAKQFPVASSGESVASELGDFTGTPDRLDAWVNSVPVLRIKLAPVRKGIYRSEYQAKLESPKDRLKRRLARVSDAFDQFQESRVRDAVFLYLAVVFGVVVDYKGRRRTRRLLRGAFQFAGLPLDKNADFFATVIRCTSEQELDCKTISKYSRALRYAARCKKPRTSLKSFVKKMGGINACAERYARYFGRKAQ